MEETHEVVLHHVGYAVRSIETEAPRLAKVLGAEWDGVITHDPLQAARVTFLTTASSHGTSRFELIEGESEDTPLGKFVAKGGGLHHVCYAVGDLDAQLSRMKKLGAVPVGPVKYAVAFGCRVGWMFTRPNLLLEYIELGIGHQDPVRS